MNIDAESVFKNMLMKACAWPFGELSISGALISVVNSMVQLQESKTATSFQSHNCMAPASSSDGLADVATSSMCI